MLLYETYCVYWFTVVDFAVMDKSCRKVNLCVNDISRRSYNKEVECSRDDFFKWSYIINDKERLSDCNRKLGGKFGAQIGQNPSIMFKKIISVSELQDKVNSVFQFVVQNFGSDVCSLRIDKLEMEILQSRIKEIEAITDNGQCYLLFLRSHKEAVLKALPEKMEIKVHRVLLKFQAVLEKLAKQHCVKFYLEKDSSPDQCICIIQGQQPNVEHFSQEIMKMKDKEAKVSFTNKHSLSEIDVERDLDRMLQDRQIACAVQCIAGKIIVYGFEDNQIDRACSLIQVEVVERVLKVPAKLKTLPELSIGQQKKTVSMFYDDKSETLYFVGLKQDVDHQYKKINERISVPTTDSASAEPCKGQVMGIQKFEIKEDLHKEEAEFLRSSSGSKILCKLNENFSVHFELHGLSETVKGSKNGSSYYWKSSSNKTLVLEWIKIEDSRANINVLLIEDDKSSE